ncbi:protein FAM47E isoform X2 [Ornithorhynchus anatinus]|uniref:protein FAM47E isoform X2 n=1 Tax=Ornithorhynchus anatinus TaxID=9258 RepID=UPI000223FBE6|nr:protein FAM47E isoform X2 [Ornithorhynchus anatinus]
MTHRERLTLPRELPPVPAGMSAKPWYKEKLPSKSFRGGKGRLIFPDALNSRRWKFLDGSVAEGRGPRAPEAVALRPGPGPAFLPPLVRHEPAKATPTPGPAHEKLREKMTEASVRASRLSACQRARRAYVSDVERRLARHPLAHYSHLEDQVSPELLAHVLETLDPEKNLQKEWARWAEIQRDEPRPVPRPKPPVRLPTRPKKTPPQNPYRWLSEGEEMREDAAYGSPPLDENVQRATKEFCDWVASLGGVQNHLDESTVRSLFATGYDVPRSFPLRVVELGRIPEELKKRLGPRLRSPGTARTGRSKSQDPYRPAWEKIRYGAWYLNPKLWKKQRADEPLKDPKVELAAQKEKLRKALQERDYRILEHHGIMAFVKFIESKGYRMPNFLTKIFAQKELAEASEVTSKPSPKRPRFKKRKIEVHSTSPHPKG